MHFQFHLRPEEKEKRNDVVYANIEKTATALGVEPASFPARTNESSFFAVHSDCCLHPATVLLPGFPLASFNLQIHNYSLTFAIIGFTMVSMNL